MKLEIKHLSAYLPYGLQMKSVGTIGIFGTGTLKAVALHPGTGGEDLLSVFVEFTKDNSRQIIFKKRDKDIIIKPILRPLSDLMNTIKIDDETFIPVNKLKGLFGWDYLWEDVHEDKQPFNINALKYASMAKLLEWHFDVFGLIDAGLAINKNNID